MKDNSDKIIADKILQTTSLSNKKVLEIGCGDGRITAFLVNKPHKLIAIEPDLKRIRKAKDKIQRGVTFQLASGENLAFSNASFDLVIFTLSLHHQNSEAAISEAVRVLNDEGEILIIEPTTKGEVQRAFSFVNSENLELMNTQKTIKKSGLKIHDSEIFNATWSFDNKEDLCKSIFNFYNEPFDNRIAAKIISLIGTKVDDEPIELLDELVIQFIKKRPDCPKPLDLARVSRAMGQNRSTC